MGRYKKQEVDKKTPQTATSFFETLTPQERMIIGAVKRCRKSDTEKKIMDIADIVKQVGHQEYVTLDDGTSLTINDMLVASAYGNAIRNPKTNFRELNFAQKVINNDTEDNNAVTINFVSNGQDLGD